MENLTHSMENLQITHDFRQIEFLIEKLGSSRYVSSATRSRIVNIFRYELKNLTNANDLLIITELINIFNSSTAIFIPQNSIIKASEYLKNIKLNREAKVATYKKEDWTEKQWFSFLVDSGKVVQEVRELFESLEVCRHQVNSSLQIIVVFGRLDKEKFYSDLITKEIMKGMNNLTAKELFRYYDGITIEGSLDSAHAMAGNDMKLIDEKSEEGTIGGFFAIGKEIFAITANHVVPHNTSEYSLKENDVAKKP